MLEYSPYSHANPYSSGSGSGTSAYGGFSSGFSSGVPIPVSPIGETRKSGGNRGIVSSSPHDKQTPVSLFPAVPYSPLPPSSSPSLPGPLPQSLPLSLQPPMSTSMTMPLSMSLSMSIPGTIPGHGHGHGSGPGQGYGNVPGLSSSTKDRDRDDESSSSVSSHLRTGMLPSESGVSQKREKRGIDAMMIDDEAHQPRQVSHPLSTQPIHKPFEHTILTPYHLLSTHIINTL